MRRPDNATVSGLGMVEHLAHILSLLHVIHASAFLPMGRE